MGCNCGKAKQQFKDMVKQVQATIQPQPPMSRSERIRLRGLRIEARNQRMAARNAAILAAEQSKKK
jgi:hypothetical protein